MGQESSMFDDVEDRKVETRARRGRRGDGFDGTDLLALLPG